MFASVARIGHGIRGFASVMPSVRVTHALLFLAASIVSPGVCDACMAPCHASGLASSVAATHCCGSPEGALPGCMADVGDGDTNTCGQSADGCRCQMAPADAAPMAIGKRLPPPVTAGDLAASPAAFAADPSRLVREAFCVSRPLPTRPLRVLYGVWRN